MDKPNIINIVDTMVTLMKSTATYVHSRIESDKAKEAYISGMAKCISYLMWKTSSETKILDIKTYILSLRAFAKADAKFNANWLMKLFSGTRAQLSYMMAIDHALDVVNTLESRFITGSGDDGPRLYKDVGEVLKEDKTLFDNNLHWTEII